MKNVFNTILLFAVICGVLASCTGGDYNVNPGSNANYVVNPLKPLTSAQFSWGTGSTPAIWSGTGVMGGVINGVSWSTNNVTWNLATGGDNVIIGTVGAKVMRLDLPSVYSGNVYTMAFHDYLQTGTWSDSVGTSYVSYYSFFGNSGEVYITENDSAYIRGMFYFEGISNSNQITAVNSGYFSFAKP